MQKRSFTDVLQNRCFSVTFAKFVRTPVLENTSGRLPLSQELLKIRTCIFMSKRNKYSMIYNAGCNMIKRAIKIVNFQDPLNVH